ncbi:MAG: crossover junction endodeoxyribonuclease RuvC [bacterium]
MIILGIDPGYGRVGYSIIEKKANKFIPHNYGLIETFNDKTLLERYFEIHIKLNEIIEEYQPEQMAVEELFFSKNVKTAIDVAQARGIILLTGHQHGLILAEYKPNEIKQAVCGYGQAKKRQMQKMVKMLLNLKEIPKPDDVADAIAVAICHGQSYGYNKHFKV